VRGSPTNRVSNERSHKRSDGYTNCESHDHPFRVAVSIANEGAKRKPYVSTISEPNSEPIRCANTRSNSNSHGGTFCQTNIGTNGRPFCDADNTSNDEPISQPVVDSDHLTNKQPIHSADCLSNALPLCASDNHTNRFTHVRANRRATV